MTRNPTQRSRGIARLAAASRTRSTARNSGRPAVPLQHPELVAEDEDLEVLGAVAPVMPAGAGDSGHEGRISS